MGLLILTKREALIMTKYKESQEAFEHALATHVLNEENNNYYFIGDWMFMQTIGELDHFKNSHTKEYIKIHHSDQRETILSREV
jgi:predicted ATPase